MSSDSRLRSGREHCEEAAEEQEAEVPEADPHLTGREQEDEKIKDGPWSCQAQGKLHTLNWIIHRTRLCPQPVFNFESAYKYVWA